MSAPQLSDANTSSEWFRKVSESGAEDRERLPSHTAITPSDAEPRRKRFVRLVTYMMLGLVAFTLLGVACFAWRQHARESALAGPVIARAERSPAPTPPALEPVVPEATPSSAPAAPLASAVKVARPATKASTTKAKKPTRSPFLSSPKSTSSKR